MGTGAGKGSLWIHWGISPAFVHTLPSQISLSPSGRHMLGVSECFSSSLQITHLHSLFNLLDVLSVPTFITWWTHLTLPECSVRNRIGSWQCMYFKWAPPKAIQMWSKNKNTKTSETSKKSYAKFQRIGKRKIISEASVTKLKLKCVWTTSIVLSGADPWYMFMPCSVSQVDHVWNVPGNFLPFINSSESNYLTMSVPKETKLTRELIAVVGLCQALNSWGGGQK